MNREAFVRSLSELGLELSESQLLAFDRFEEALYRANEVMNLTRVPREECYIRHFLDSLLIEPLIPKDARLLDIGSGPGFPAWPLAVVRPDITVTAIDSSGKMIGFLRTQLLPNLRAIQARAEEYDMGEEFDLVTGRALAPLAIQLELSAYHGARGGHIVPMRTPADIPLFNHPEVRRLGLRWRRTETRTLPGTEIVRQFPIYQRVGEKPKRRTWAEIRKRPYFG